MDNNYYSSNNTYPFEEMKNLAITILLTLFAANAWAQESAENAANGLDISDYEIIQWSGFADEWLKVINKTGKKTSELKIAVQCMTVAGREWVLIAKVPSLPLQIKNPYTEEIKYSNTYKLGKDMTTIPNFNEGILAIAIKTRTGERYSYKVYAKHDDLVVEIYEYTEPAEVEEDW